MNLVLLLGIELLLFGIGYYKTNRDFVAPANFSLFIFIFATIFAIMGSNMWSVSFSNNSVLYISCGLFTILFSQFIVYGLNRKKIKKNYEIWRHNRNYGRINIATFKIVILDFVVILLTILYMYDILRTGASLGSVGLSAISAVKYSDTVQTSSLLRQGIKIIMAASFVSGFIVTRNIVYGWKKMDILHVIPLICAIICSIFTGVRTEVLRIIFALFCLYYLSLKEKNNWKSRGVLRKLFKKFFPIIILAAIGFSSLKTLVKSSDLPINSAFTTIEYISYYIGSPILVFGIKESMGFNTFKRALFGEITLNAFWEDIASMGIIPSSYLHILSTNVYISKTDQVTANVDTIFGGLMIDFGFWGMILFIFVLYTALSLFYFRKVKFKKIYANEFIYMYYGFLFYLPAMSYYADLFGQFVAIYYILTVILIYFIYIFYFRLSFIHGITLKKSTSIKGIYEMQRCQEID